MIFQRIEMECLDANAVMPKQAINFPLTLITGFQVLYVERRQGLGLQRTDRPRTDLSRTCHCRMVVGLAIQLGTKQVRLSQAKVPKYDSTFELNQRDIFSIARTFAFSAHLPDRFPDRSTSHEPTHPPAPSLSTRWAGVRYERLHYGSSCTGLWIHMYVMEESLCEKRH